MQLRLLLWNMEWLNDLFVAGNGPAAFRPDGEKPAYGTGSVTVRKRRNDVSAVIRELEPDIVEVVEAPNRNEELDLFFRTDVGPEWRTFLQPTSGRILVDERDVSSLPPHKRNAGMVFQDYALFPHMMVSDNIAFGLHERGQRGAAVEKRVAELLALVRLTGMGERYPGALSGGQQQRVALARALAFGPSALLMDEPFGALDQKLREVMQVELVQIQRQLGITTIFVTHDQHEAMTVANRIAVMSGGRIEQLGRPEEVYNRPANSFVAQFVGKINLFAARITGVAGSTVVLDASGASSPHRATVGRAGHRDRRSRAAGEPGPAADRPSRPDIGSQHHRRHDRGHPLRGTDCHH